MTVEGKGSQSELTVCQVRNKISSSPCERAKPKHGLQSADIYSHGGQKEAKKEKRLSWDLMSGPPIVRWTEERGGAVISSSM